MELLPSKMTSFLSVNEGMENYYPSRDVTILAAQFPLQLSGVSREHILYYGLLYRDNMS